MPGPLIDSPAVVIRQLLIAQGAGADPTAQPLQAWPVYATGEPSVPDNCITVTDTEGRVDGRVPDGEQQESHGIQVRIRSAVHMDGYAKANGIKILLDKVYWVKVAVGTNQYVIQVINRTSDILPLGKQTPATKRNLFTINAQVVMRQGIPNY